MNNPHPLDVSGRTVIVSGATRGLGRSAMFVAADVRDPDQIGVAAVPVHGGGEGPAYLGVSTGDVTEVDESASDHE